MENTPFSPSFHHLDSYGTNFEIIAKTGSDNNYTYQFSEYRHDFIKIVWVSKLTATYIVDEMMYEVKDNELLIIPANSPYYEKHQPYEGFVFSFAYDFFNSEQSRLLQNFSILDPLKSNRLLKIGLQPHLIVLLDLIVQEYTLKPYPLHLLSLQYLFFILLIKLENVNQSQENKSLPISKEGKIYRDFVLLLEEHYKQQVTASFYAQKLGMSLKSLNQNLLIATNKTTGAVIFERVMLEAKRYLSYSNKSIKEIAYELGFEDSHYFSRIFKKKTAHTPKEFREKFALKST